MPRAGSRYGYEHEQLRRSLKPHVEAGEVTCWRCGELITPGEPWDLGHDDHDPTVHKGPEHAGRCNRSAAAVKRNAMYSRQNRRSRDWFGPRRG